MSRASSEGEEKGMKRDTSKQRIITSHPGIFVKTRMKNYDGISEILP